MKYSFAARLKKARLEAGLTQNELAEICGRRTRMWVSKYETGRAIPLITTVQIFMKALKMDANYFIK